MIWDRRLHIPEKVLNKKAIFRQILLLIDETDTEVFISQEQILNTIEGLAYHLEVEEAVLVDMKIEDNDIYYDIRYEW